MAIEILPSGEALGAEIYGVDLSQSLSDADAADIRAAWLGYHVLAFPDQKMNDDDLERFTLSFGPFGDDPFIAPIEGRKHIVAIKREATETSSIFAENWHTDWSFQKTPPAGTCLYGIDIPPVGGDTYFANQHLALDKMPAELRAKLEGKMAIHSARAPYAKEGVYGEKDRDTRSMDIRASDDAHAEQLHPIIRAHPETGRLGIFSCAGYIVGIEGLDEAASTALLGELYLWQTREEFQHRRQ